MQYERLLPVICTTAAAAAAVSLPVAISQGKYALLGKRDDDDETRTLRPLSGWNATRSR